MHVYTYYNLCTHCFPKRRSPKSGTLRRGSMVTCPEGDKAMYSSYLYSNWYHIG